MTCLEFHKNVPRDKAKNIAFRRKLHTKCADLGYRRDVLEMCRQDILFWALAFGLVHEPRIPAHLPFIPWGYEEELLVDLHDSVIWQEMGVNESRDLTAVKSRGTGFTWSCCYLIDHRFLFQEGFTAGIVSASAEKVDNGDDPNSIMFKAEYIINWLPKWMQPLGWPRLNQHRQCRAAMRMTNYDESGKLFASVFGYSATEDAARGGRTTMFMFDEVAHFPDGQDFALYSSLQPITDCRVMGSTPNGTGGLFYERVHDKDAEHKLVRMGWWKHPKWKHGLYTSRKVGGEWKLNIIDADYEFPEGYPFILDGILRSPWYDRQERRSPGRSWMAQNYDMDFLGSGSPFFDIPTLIQLQKPPHAGGTARDPDRRGDLYWSEETPKWVDNRLGHFKLWIEPVEGEIPGCDPFVVACDIASGGGDKGSNSAISVVNRRTGQKVGEYVANDIDPQDLAELAVWTCKWFHGAFLIWDAQGPNGTLFGKHIRYRTDYRYFFYRTNEDDRSRRDKRRFPGFATTDKNKPGLLGDYASALRTAEFVNPSFEALEECKAYVRLDGKRIGHQSSKATNSPGASSESHGDIAIADALAWRAMREFPKFAGTEQKPVISDAHLPEQCLARRRMRWRREEMEESFW